MDGATIVAGLPPGDGTGCRRRGFACATGRTRGRAARFGTRLAGETPTFGELIGSQGRGVGLCDGKRAREHAHPAAAALAHAAAGKFDAVRGEAGDERAAAREVELDAERLETDADKIGRSYGFHDAVVERGADLRAGRNDKKIGSIPGTVDEALEQRERALNLFEGPAFFFGFGARPARQASSDAMPVEM